MIIKIKLFFSKCYLLLNAILKFLVKPEVTTIIGLILTVLTFALTQNYQKKHDFYQSILKEQIESDVNLLEIVGGLISQEDRLSKESKALKSQFMAIYYGRMLFFESCFVKDTNRVEYLRDLKESIDNYYGKKESWGITLDDIKFKAYNVSVVFSNSYSKVKENECLL